VSPDKIGKRKKRMSKLRNIGENEDPESGSAQFEFTHVAVLEAPMKRDRASGPEGTAAPHRGGKPSPDLRKSSGSGTGLRLRLRNAPSGKGI